jgi:hypothetical protein
MLKKYIQMLHFWYKYINAIHFYILPAPDLLRKKFPSYKIHGYPFGIYVGTSKSFRTFLSVGYC